MKRKTEIILVLLLLILAGAWRYIFWHPGIYGTDVLYHYTITEQAIQQQKLSNENNLALCYEGIKGGHPYGFYALPYFFGKIIGLDNTFIILPIILSSISLILAYIFIKQIFNRKVALIMLFFSAISLAHISKSFPFSWRGENLIYPFILLALIFIQKSFSEKKKIYSVLSGIVSGATIWFWNGYPLVIIIYLSSIGCFILYKYIKRDHNFVKEINNAIIGVITQAIVIGILFSIIRLWSKGLEFTKGYYLFLVIGMIVFLLVLKKGYESRSHKYILFLAFGAIIASIIFFQKIKVLLEGFGSVKAANLLIMPELNRTQPSEYFFAFHVLLITSIVGIYYLIKNFNAKKALFMGLLLPALYLIVTASRYIYFAAIPIITLTAITLDNKKTIKNKFDIFVFGTMVLMIFMFIYSLYAVPTYYSANLEIKNIDPYIFLKENSEKDACIIDITDRGATVEVFAKRYFYFNSLGYDSDRGGTAAHLLLLNDIQLEIDHLYVLLNYANLNKINLMNTYLGLEDIGFYRTAMVGNIEPMNVSEIKEELGFMKAIYVDNSLIVNETGRGCAYVTQEDIFYLKNGVCNTTIFKMVTNQEVKDFRNIYSKDGYVIYKYEPNAS